MDIDKITKGLKCCSRCTNDDPFEGCDNCPYNPVSVSVQECRAVLCSDALELIRAVLCSDALELIKWQAGTIRGLESCLQETLEELTNARKETETETSEHSVKQEDVAGIMNTINDALEGSRYCAVGYDNTGMFLQVLIEGAGEKDDE